MGDELSTVRAAVVDIGEGAVVRRGSVFFKVPGVRAFPVLSLLFGGAKRRTFSTSADIVDLICSTHPDVPKSSADKLVQRLIEQRFILATAPRTEEEGETEILHWDLGDLPRRTASTSVLILGLNRISRALVKALDGEPLIEMRWADIPQLRTGPVGTHPEIEAITAADALSWLGIGGPKLIVATCDFGGQHLLREWNEIAVRNRVPFFPVLLDGWRGFLGPLVIPGESPCLECVRTRENSNFENAAAVREAENHARSLSSHSGGHSTFPSTIANMAAFTVHKYSAGLLRSEAHSELLEFDLVRPALVPHKVLRVPRCRVCAGSSVTSAFDLSV